MTIYTGTPSISSSSMHSPHSCRFHASKGRRGLRNGAARSSCDPRAGKQPRAHRRPSAAAAASTREQRHCGTQPAAATLTSMAPPKNAAGKYSGLVERKLRCVTSRDEHRHLQAFESHGVVRRCRLKGHKSGGISLSIYVDCALEPPSALL